MQYQQKPTAAQWKNIFELSRQFAQLESWKYITDADYFGVEDPEGIVYYCSILGNLKESYGILFYRGASGLYGRDVTEALADQIDEEQAFMEILGNQDSLRLEFLNRLELSFNEKKIIKDSGVSFDGLAGFPHVQSMVPGYYPWTINSEEADILIRILPRVIEMMTAVKENKLSVTPDDRHFDKVLVSSLSKGGWLNKWILPQDHAFDIVLSPELLDRCETEARETEKSGATWEIDFFFNPDAVRSNNHDPKEIPYFPVCVVPMDTKSGAIITPTMAPFDNRFTALTEAVLEAVKTSKTIPEKIITEREDLAAALEAIADRMNFKVIRSELSKEYREMVAGYYEMLSEKNK